MIHIFPSFVFSVKILSSLTLHSLESNPFPAYKEVWEVDFNKLLYCSITGSEKLEELASSRFKP
ncbi:MAG: hypothetical protein ACKD6N_01155 [Candidatus Bathyarchaeota archaeon]